MLLLSHNFDPFIGGIEVTSEVLAKAFVKAGYEVRLMTWTPEPSSESYNFEIIRNPSLWQVIKEHKWADLVFENNPCIRLAWPGIFIKRPSVVVLHTWISRSNGKIGIRDRIKGKWWLDRAQKVIAVSSALKEKSYKDALMLGNFYRENQFKIIEGIPRDKSYVFLGRLVRDKGAELAIRAIYELKKKHSKTLLAEPNLTLIGDGPERENLEALIQELDLQEQVTFLGKLSGQKLVECLNRFRFILVPSIWEEPFGLVALEGMACGCIPIVSEGGGLPEAIGNAGVTFKKGKLQSLVTSMRQLADDPKKESMMRIRATEHLKNFKSDQITQRYLKEVESALTHS